MPSGFQASLCNGRVGVQASRSLWILQFGLFTACVVDVRPAPASRTRVASLVAARARLLDAARVLASFPHISRGTPESCCKLFRPLGKGWRTPGNGLMYSADNDSLTEIEREQMEEQWRREVASRLDRYRGPPKKEGCPPDLSALRLRAV